MDPVSAVVLIGAIVLIVGAIIVGLVLNRTDSGTDEPEDVDESASTYENEERNRFAFLAEQRLALTILRPEAFTRLGGLDLYKSEMVPPDMILLSDAEYPEPVGLTAEEVGDLRGKAHYAQYEPQGLILHPRDHDHLMADQGVRSAPGEYGSPERVAAQKQIADAFGLPYWLVGVDGVKPPLDVRVRRFWRSLPRRGRRLLARLPLVYDYGYVPTKGSWMYDGPTERRGRWWVQIGPLRVGWGWDEEDW